VRVLKSLFKAVFRPTTVDEISRIEACALLRFPFSQQSRATSQQSNQLTDQPVNQAPSQPGRLTVGQSIYFISARSGLCIKQF